MKTVGYTFWMFSFYLDWFHMSEGTRLFCNENIFKIGTTSWIGDTENNEWIYRQRILQNHFAIWDLNTLLFNFSNESGIWTRGVIQNLKLFEIRTLSDDIGQEKGFLSKSENRRKYNRKKTLKICFKKSDVCELSVLKRTAIESKHQYLNALYKVSISFLATTAQFLLTYLSFPLDYCFWLDTVHHLLIYLDKFHTGAVETHDQTTVGKISVEIFSTVVPTVRACSSRAVHILPFVCRISYISKNLKERVLRMV